MRIQKRISDIAVGGSSYLRHDFHAPNGENILSIATGDGADIFDVLPIAGERPEFLAARARNRDVILSLWQNDAN